MRHPATAWTVRAAFTVERWQTRAVIKRASANLKVAVRRHGEWSVEVRERLPPRLMAPWRCTAYAGVGVCAATPGSARCAGTEPRPRPRPRSRRLQRHWQQNRAVHSFLPIGVPYFQFTSNTSCYAFSQCSHTHVTISQKKRGRRKRTGYGGCLLEHFFVPLITKPSFPLQNARTFLPAPSAPRTG